MLTNMDVATILNFQSTLGSRLRIRAHPLDVHVTQILLPEFFGLNRKSVKVNAIEVGELKIMI